MNKLVLALGALGVVGCASMQLPLDEIERFEAQVRSAKTIASFAEPTAGERGAFGMSAARTHLELATDQVEVAKTMARAGDTRALLLLARAQSDADLAVGIARKAEMHRRALEATESFRAAPGSQDAVASTNDSIQGSSR
jgi:hypothetical protein